MTDNKALKEKKSVWSGVYERFDEVKSPSAAFDTDIWVAKQKEKVLNLLREQQSGTYIPDAAKSRDYPLAAIVSGLLAVKDKISVIDYGGAMGQTYIDLVTKVPGAASCVNYNVVETSAVVNGVPPEVKAYKNLSFVPDRKIFTGPVDIVHMGSTLHYIEDWQDLFNGLIADNNPQIFVLSDLLVGEIPTFVTAQKYYTGDVPVKCINIGEFLEFWGRAGYANTYRSHYYPLGTEDYFPNHDLPEEYRVKTAAHLVFNRIKKG